MAATVKIVYHPDVGLSESSLIPSINIENPYKPSERLIPDLLEDDAYPGLFFFELPDLGAKKILGANSHIFKLWEPEALKVLTPKGNGTETMVEHTSFKVPYTKAKAAAAAAAAKAAKDEKK